MRRILSSFFMILREFLSKLSALRLGEILRVFVNTLNVDDKYRVNIASISHSQFKCNYIKNEKLFRNFLFHFWNMHQILTILIEKMIVIANVFPKLQTAKNIFRTLSKKRCFRACSNNQHMKASQTLVKSPWEHFYHVFSSFSGKLNWKMSPLVLHEILGVFVNTLTGDGKYPVQDCQNFPVAIQMQVSEKRKSLSQFFFPFLESTSNFKHFEKKDCHS